MAFRNTTRGVIAALLSAGLVMSAAAPAAAQNTQQQGQVKTDWSEEKIEQFVQASVAISEAQSKWTQRIQQAESQEKKQKLQKQANEAVLQKIKDQGLSTSEYNRIYKAAEQDKEFYNELTDRIEKAKNN